MNMVTTLLKNTLRILMLFVVFFPMSTILNAKELHNKELMDFIQTVSEIEGLDSNVMFDTYLDLVDIENHSYDEISKTLSFFEQTWEFEKRHGLYQLLAKKLNG